MDGRRFLRRHWATVLIAGLFLWQWVSLFQVRVPVWDAAYYYGLARSVVFDGDLQVENDLLLAPVNNPSYEASQLARLEENRTVTGRLHIPFAIGSSLIWMPFLGVLRLVVGGTGYEPIYLATAAAVSAVVGGLAFWLSYWVGEEMVDKQSEVEGTGRFPIVAATITLMFTTPLLFYQFREPIYSHAFSALTNALVVVVWWRGWNRPVAWSGGLVMGAVIGLSALVRWQHVIYLLLPAMTMLFYCLRERQWRPVLAYGVAVGVAVVALFSVQMGVWRLFYGSWLTVPQGSSFMVWTGEFWREVLFSPFRGWLYWMPVGILALIGYAPLVHRRPKLFGPLLLVLLVEIYVNSSALDWFAGGGYGPRRFTSALVLLVIGYAGWLSWWPRRVSVVLAVVSGWLLAGQQFILLQYGLRERIGGRVVWMIPTFEWEATSGGEFWRQIGVHWPELWQSPAQMWLGSGSLLLAWSWVAVAGLGIAVLGIGVAVGLVKWGGKNQPVWWVLPAGCLILTWHLWLWLWA